MSNSSVHEQAFHAVTAGDANAIRALLNSDPSVLNATNAEGVSLLMSAIYNGKKDIADLFIQRGIRLDVFSAAALGALKEIVEIVGYEPDLVNTFSADGWSPLHLASFFGNMRVVEHLVMSRAEINAISRNSLKNQPLHAATVSNRTDVARFLLKKGADVNFVQHGGIAPLHAAAHNGNDVLVKILLAHGANPNTKDDKGETPADKAIHQGHAHIVSLLRSP